MKKLLLLLLITFTLGLSPAGAYYDESPATIDSKEYLTSDCSKLIDNFFYQIFQINEHIAQLEKEITELLELYPTEEIEELISDKELKLVTLKTHKNLLYKEFLEKLRACEAEANKRSKPINPELERDKN